MTDRKIGSLILGVAPRAIPQSIAGPQAMAG
jgi:hypothetical protein